MDLEKIKSIRDKLQQAKSTMDSLNVAGKGI